MLLLSIQGQLQQPLRVEAVYLQLPRPLSTITFPRLGNAVVLAERTRKIAAKAAHREDAAAGMEVVKGLLFDGV